VALEADAVLWCAACFRSTPRSTTPIRWSTPRVSAPLIVRVSFMTRNPAAPVIQTLVVYTVMIRLSWRSVFETHEVVVVVKIKDS
jgi:hypothetical protein